MSESPSGSENPIEGGSGGEPAAPAPPPVCPRHPSEISYVSCQRCRRPACPACQRPAAVGIHCVDCVREAAATQRKATTVFGGTPTGGRPLVSMTLIAACIAVYVLQWAVPGLTSRLAFVPALAFDEPWRFLTSAFAHSTSLVMHIAFNLYAVWVLGGYLEDLLGRARFAALYLVSALGGSVGYLLLATPTTIAEAQATGGGQWWTGAVGASGAVFGLFGALLVLQRRLGRSTSGVTIIILANAVLGFVIPGIAWQAHLGGLVTGAAIGWIVGFLGGRRSPTAPAATAASWAVHWAGILAVTAVLVGLALARYLTL